MKVEEFLLYVSSIKVGSYDKRRIYEEIDEKIDLFNLEKSRKKKLKRISGGQLRRVGLAQAFLWNPKIVLLDEPTTGLDPRERIRFKNYISNNKGNQIIFLSTHIVSDLENITDNIIIMKDGYFVENGREEELVGKLNGRVVAIRRENLNVLSGKKYIIVKEFEYNGEVLVRVILEDSKIEGVKLLKPTLEDMYMYYFEKR